MINSLSFYNSCNLFYSKCQIIGNTGEIAGNRNARRTFEVFRTNLGGIEIITFDELYERAKFIAHNDEPNAMPPADDGFADSPF